jgi:hypothetical protein
MANNQYRRFILDDAESLEVKDPKEYLKMRMNAFASKNPKEYFKETQF